MTMKKLALFLPLLLSACVTGDELRSQSPRLVETGREPLERTDVLVARHRAGTRSSVPSVLVLILKAARVQSQRPGSPCASTRAPCQLHSCCMPARCCVLCVLTVFLATGSSTSQQQQQLIIAPLPARKGVQAGPDRALRFWPTG